MHVDSRIGDDWHPNPSCGKIVAQWFVGALKAVGAIVVIVPI